MKQDVLEIHSSDNTLVPNTFIRQETSNQLAILFPGRGYNADMPLLYYTTEVLTRHGADVLQLRYTYQTESFQSLNQEAQYQKIIADCSAAYATAIKQRNYTRITLVGKSLGTLALGHLLTRQPELSNATFIWLTPLFNHRHLHKQIMSLKHHALFVIGTKDPLYNPNVLREVESKTGGESLVIKDADHGLEVEGVLESLDIMQHYISKLAIFLEKA
jgi:predicted alpha/beta-hydrolase family hydrolase